MDEPIAANGTIAHAFRSASDAQTAVTRLRTAGFADVRLSERAGDTREAHVPAEAGLTEDDFARTLEGAGFTSGDASRLARAAAAGRTIVTVAAGERSDVALAVLRGDAVASANVGPVDVAPAPSQPLRPVAPASGELSPGDRVVPLREERLDVSTQPEMGEARIRRETVVEQKTITIPVRHDELVIERDDAEPVRIPVSGDATTDSRT